VPYLQPIKVSLFPPTVIVIQVGIPLSIQYGVYPIFPQQSTLPFKHVGLHPEELDEELDEVLDEALGFLSCSKV